MPEPLIRIGGQHDCQVLPSQIGKMLQQIEPAHSRHVDVEQQTTVMAGRAGEEINIGGSLVGNFTELVELMELNADGKVKMHYTRYSLDDINVALDDFKNRRFAGRGVIVP